MNIGFTGTHKGMTLDQQVSFIKIVKQISNIVQFHHGDCIGADAQSHDIMIRLCPIIIHPPIKTYRRAWKTGYAFIHPEKDYIERDHDIVNDTNVLIATPFTRKEVIRSGTWTTFRYAKEKKKDFIIIYPNGEFESTLSIIEGGSKI